MKPDDAALSMSPQQVSIDVLLEKYAKGDEQTIEEVRSRVARALAAVEQEPAKWEPVFYEALANGFIPGGRVNSARHGPARHTDQLLRAAGGRLVSEVVDGKPGIYVALMEAAETMRRGGGVGYDFSSIRRAAAFVKGTHSSASGPVSYMRVFDRELRDASSPPARAAARRWGMLRCDHPRCGVVHPRQGPRRPQELQRERRPSPTASCARGSRRRLGARAQGPAGARLRRLGYQRADGAWVYRKVKARDLWQQIMQSTYDHAEPGVIFIDRVNNDDNLSYCEGIAATNPCARQPLPPYGCCCLGSVNLALFVADPFTPKARFRLRGLRRVVRPSVRMLDNVLDVTVWPLPQQAAEGARQAPHRPGLHGLGDTLIMAGPEVRQRRGAPDGREDLRGDARRVLRGLHRARAGEGRLPLLDADRYLAPPRFASRLPGALQSAIRKHGLRNSHLLSIAPTGTISLAFADNASNGIEPPYSWTYQRKKRMRTTHTRPTTWRTTRAAVPATWAATSTSSRRTSSRRSTSRRSTT